MIPAFSAIDTSLLHPRLFDCCDLCSCSPAEGVQVSQLLALSRTANTPGNGRWNWFESREDPITAHYTFVNAAAKTLLNALTVFISIHPVGRPSELRHWS